jgi:hypothetical protein
MDAEGEGSRAMRGAAWICGDDRISSRGDWLHLGIVLLRRTGAGLYATTRKDRYQQPYSN